MPHMPAGQPRAKEMTGTCWTSPRRATLAEIHPLLMAIIILMPNYQDWGLYSADVWDMASGGPLGYFDISFDPPTRRACGYYNAVGSSVVMRSPRWFQCTGDINDAMRAFHALVREAGYVH
ncbi:hypothetical protein SAMN05216228_102784 [Rhizobium tibeticum]|uniref:Uncharacterized protein n=2 Tax=Rhizobium tibeticum TaxID=501024 RepID=A0A1H8T6Z4_9HYPH|nr:hypothetical protein RTCCBAU85039_5024 [Rhizobium tibeticum]SEO86727.1 hypothetical protein SAMN05216228_102784 [Rhizobium tibeticum]